MEITGKVVPDAIDTYAPDTRCCGTAAGGGRRPVSGDERDKVVLSPRAREIQEAGQQALSAPEVRADKVHRIRQQLSAGTYTVHGGKIALSMITESIINQKA